MAVPPTAEILDRITDGFFVLDRQGRFTYVNRPAEEVFQTSREALLGHSIWALFPQAADRHVFDKYREAVQEQRPVRFEETLPVQERCFDVHLYPDAEGTSVFFRDITERKRAEVVLRESEARFRSLVIATSQIVWTTAPTGESRGEQPGWSAFTGQCPEEYGGLGWLDAVHPEDRARTIEVFSAALRERSPYELEHRLRRHDGEYRHMRARGAPVLEADGRIREWVDIHTDISNEKRAEEALKESETRFHTMADTAPVLIWMSGTDMLCDWFNRPWLEYTGRTMEEEQGNGWADGVHPEDYDRCLQIYTTSFAVREPFSMEYRLRRHDGAYRWMLDNGVPRFAPNGTFAGYIGSLVDVHEQVEQRGALEAANRELEAHTEELQSQATLLEEVQAELEITNDELQRANEDLRVRTQEAERSAATVAESEARLQFMLDAAQLGVWELDLRTKIAWRSLQHDRIFGYESLLHGWTYEQFLGHVDPEDRPVVNSAFRRTLATGEPWAFECRITRADGASRWIRGRGEAQCDSEGRPQRLLGAVEDVTERKVAEGERETLLEQARRARAEAEAANQAKSDLLATMSHELRTPLNAILGYADLLAMGIGGALSDQQLMHLSRIRVGGEHLIVLIDDILDFAKVEAGRMDVAQESALAMDAVNAALSLVAPQATARGIVIEAPCAEDNGVSFTGDGGRVRQILTNLMSNAVKFTEPGGRIRLTCGTTADPEAEAQLRSAGPWTYVGVEDTGIGIAPEHLAAVFLPFHQVDSGHTRSYGGTGLGLAISRRFARLMGGDLTVRSRPGAGSIFTLWLPAGEGDGSSTGEALAPALPAVELPTSLAAVGDAVQAELEAITAAYVERLRIDPEVPQASDLSEVELEDHVAAFVADVAQALVILDETDGEPTLLRDSADIQRLISERHGAQRARLGWSEHALRREFTILREELSRAVRHRVTADTDEEAEAAIAVLERSLSHAERISVAGLRRAAAAGEV